jgi:small subunit ribosomal protein S20
LAHHKSAKKRVRQNEKRRARNRHERSRVKSAIKSVQGAEDPPTALRAAESTLRRAASKGVLSKKQASRIVSRLAKRVASASA